MLSAVQILEGVDFLIKFATHQIITEVTKFYEYSLNFYKLLTEFWRQSSGRFCGEWRTFCFLCKIVYKIIMKWRWSGQFVIEWKRTFPNFQTSCKTLITSDHNQITRDKQQKFFKIVIKSAARVSVLSAHMLFWSLVFF